MGKIEGKMIVFGWKILKGNDLKWKTDKRFEGENQLTPLLSVRFEGKNFPLLLIFNYVKFHSKIQSG